MSETDNASLYAGLKTSDFDYDLPEELIAQTPSPRRGQDRLMIQTPGGQIDGAFADLPNWLEAGDTLVVNNTRVMKARLKGEKDTGGAIEVMVDRLAGENEAWCLTRASHAPKEGMKLNLGEGVSATVLRREGDSFLLRFEGEDSLFQALDKAGELPLPPYIKREANENDLDRYQTVYAKEIGAVAAPTAGLHFTEDLLDEIRARGVTVAHLTLHVGAGTFLPVREEDVSRHKMHSEWFQIPQSCAEAIAQTRSNGKKVCAVGTTALRALETAAQKGPVRKMSGTTDLFVAPGYEFRCCDMLLTNFHLPKSTLLMLVSAFAGVENIKRMYQEAARQRYRFFSYGDAMLLSRNPRNP